MKNVYIVCFYDRDYSGEFTFDLKNTKDSALECLFYILKNFDNDIGGNDDSKSIIYNAETALNSSNFNLLEHLLNDYVEWYNASDDFITYEIKEQKLPPCD
jgi:hypothetical protein